MSTDSKIRWDVRTDSGTVVTDLTTLAAVLDTDRTNAAAILRSSASYKAAPAGLRQEADQELRVKAGSPPSIDSGSFVQWGSNRGRVDLVVTNGKVPGVEDDVEGSKDSPAVRVVVWEKDGDGYKPSRKKIGAMVHTLKRIAPLHPAKALPGERPGEDLVSLLAEHEARGLPDHAQVTAAAVSAVYNRGIKAWPGEHSTTLTRQQWAVGRVKAFLAVASGEDPHGYYRDLGLLSKAHPRHPQYRPTDWVEITAEELTNTAASLALDE